MTNDHRFTIETAIRRQTQEWLSTGKADSVHAIGSGLCYEFAEELLDRLSDIPGIALGETESWWSDDFHADIAKLRSEGAPLPKHLSDRDLAHLIGAATHMWIIWNGMHFDATAPEGREHFLLMPFFADQLSHARAA